MLVNISGVPFLSLFRICSSDCDTTTAGEFDNTRSQSSTEISPEPNDTSWIKVVIEPEDQVPTVNEDIK